MQYLKYLSLGFFLLVCGSSVYAAHHCPDPETSSLKYGIPPYPWEVNPFSENSPQADENTQFVQANILVAGFGRGVMCTYRNSLGEYSIWWQVLTKIPSRMDYNWIDTLGGFVCTEGLVSCEFYVASSMK